MSTHEHDDEDRNQPDATERAVAPSTTTKKTYRSPNLIEYGDLQRITAGAGGNKGDSTPPGGRSRT